MWSVFVHECGSWITTIQCSLLGSVISGGSRKWCLGRGAEETWGSAPTEGAEAEPPPLRNGKSVFVNTEMLKLVHNAPRYESWITRAKSSKPARMFQWDAVDTSPDLGGQNVLKTFEMATWRNRRTTRTELDRVCRAPTYNTIRKERRRKRRYIISEKLHNCSIKMHWNHLASGLLLGERTSVLPRFLDPVAGFT